MAIIALLAPASACTLVYDTRPGGADAGADEAEPEAPGHPVAGADAAAGTADKEDPSSFSRRRPVVITGSMVGELSDYAVQVLVALDDDMQSDFDDVRFVDSDGETQLAHFRASAGETARFWVKVPSIPAGPATKIVYMYYGNEGADSASSGDDTFLFFDDFESGSADRWEPSDAPVVNDEGNMVLRMEPTPNLYRAGDWSDVMVSSMVKYVDTGPNDYKRHGIDMRASESGNYSFSSVYGDGSVHSLRQELDDLNTCTVSLETGVWYEYSISAYGDALRGWVDGVLRCSASNSQHDTGGIGLRMWGTGFYNYVDDIYVRPYVIPEPSAAGPGPEERLE